MDKKQREALRHRQYRKSKKENMNKLKALHAYILRKDPELLKKFETVYSLSNKTSPQVVLAFPQVIQGFQVVLALAQVIQGSQVVLALLQVMQTPSHIMQTPQESSQAELNTSTLKDIPALETWLELEEFNDDLLLPIV